MDNIPSAWSNPWIVLVLTAAVCYAFYKIMDSTTKGPKK